MYINKTRAINTFIEMARIDSLSLYEYKMADYLRGVFSNMGYEVIEDKKSKIAVQGASTGNLIVKIPPRAEGTSIIICAHMDTVAPGIGIEPIIDEEQGIVLSRGDTILGADDKAGIAQVIEVIRCVHDGDFKVPSIELLFTFAEEIGLIGAKNIDKTLLSGEHLFVIDGGPDVCDVVVQGPASYKLNVKFIGKTANAIKKSDEGISAIKVLADFISKVKTGKINDEMTFNISSINSNGPLNMVPAEASLISEIRSMDDVVAKNFINDLDSLINKLCKSHNAYYDMIVEERVKAFKILTDSAIVQQILKVDKELGIFTRLKHSSGATDLSALYSILDIDGLVLTVGSQNEHSKNEILYIDKFLQCIDRLLALVMSYGQL